MFRLIPHRAFVEPRAAVTTLSGDDAETSATLRIDGLLCSACASNVQRRLEGVDGVRSADVDLDRGVAQVRYDPACATPAALVEAVESAVILRPLRRLLAALSGRPTTRAAH